MIKKVKKRDGSIMDFSPEKISHVIIKAMEAVNCKDQDKVPELSQKITFVLDSEFGNRTPEVEDIQDIVEKVLIESGHAMAAKAFILYRKKRQEIREAKSALGIEDDMKLSFQALRVLSQYKLLRAKEDGRPERPSEMFRRAAKALSRIERKYGADPLSAEKDFVEPMLNLELLPSVNILQKAGTEQEQLSDGFVLPLEDDISSLFETLKKSALLHKHRQRAFGLGYSFSPIRSKGSMVGNSAGNAAGPVAFLKLYDQALGQINPFGTNMAFLNIHHPDILDFLTFKENSGLSCFGTSVLLTKKFMRAVEEDAMYDLIDPKTQEAVTQLRARSVFDMLATIAWRTGDPAVVFLDNLNKFPANPFEDRQIEATTPTGEQPLLPHEGCFTASINLGKHIKDNDFDWNRLKKTVWTGVRILDNAIDACTYSSSLMKNATEETRRIGLGVMGLADALISLNIAFNSPDALKLAEKVMKFVNNEAKEASLMLAQKRGPFAGYEKSRKGEKIRNACRTTISHSAIISIIAGCSQGIEPYYAISYLQRSLGQESIEVNPSFEAIARKENFYSAELMKKIALAGSLQSIKEVPEFWRKIFITTHDCDIATHLNMQLAFQKFTDNGVSKTINLPSNATIQEVEDILRKSYDAGCRSIHIYREGSSMSQLINSKSKRRGGLKWKKRGLQ